jgi:hypothetical protein
LPRGLCPQCALQAAAEASNDGSQTEPAHLDVPANQPGDFIGRYKLLQQIGEGGCGVVFMAEQAEPIRRKVALKVIKLGMDTKSVIARFEAERQALALMDHPYFVIATRTLSPSSLVTAQEMVPRLIEENSLASLQSAARLAPANAIALARLAKKILELPVEERPRRLEEVEFLLRRASALAPDNVEIASLRKTILDATSIQGAQ